MLKTRLMVALGRRAEEEGGGGGVGSGGGGEESGGDCRETLEMQRRRSEDEMVKREGRN